MKPAYPFRLFIGIAATLCLLTLSLAAQSPAPASTTVPSRDYITARLAELRKIHTPEGIEALEEVTLGGTRQWVSMRGLNRANPVLLFIHGGPGTPMMPMTWAYQAPWEDFFTVVQWDQRGVGKNAVTADREALKPTMTTERIIADAEELTAWVRKRLGKEKIVVMGYSYGTSIAMTGGPEAALIGFLLFYVLCAAITFMVYTRKGGLLHDIERGRAHAGAALPKGETA